jgi:hypothetical protein
MSKGAYINEEGKLVVDMAEADKLWNSMGMEQQYNAMCAMFDPLLATATEQAARIRELEAQVGWVTVKPLKWFVGSSRSNDGDHEAQTMLGTYSCRKHKLLKWNLWKSERLLDSSETLEAAKAKAQADYERRILSALSPAPVTVSEAARVLLDEWSHGEGPLGDLSCYSVEMDGTMQPDIDGEWVRFAKLDAALRALIPADGSGEG